MDYFARPPPTRFQYLGIEDMVIYDIHFTIKVIFNGMFFNVGMPRLDSRVNELLVSNSRVA